jgi:UDP-N-acetylmuramate: L-alanyl-gamma-D-glutamyl-meso-diaminopimelate ligase
LAQSTAAADQVLWFEPAGVDWSLGNVVSASPVPAQLQDSIDSMVDACVQASEAGSHVVVMSNGGFGGIHQKLLARLANHSLSGTQEVSS